MREAGRDPKTRTNASHVYFDGMGWPKPDHDLGWRLRYGTPTRTDLLAAAAILDAYAQMVSDPTAKRQRVVRHIRAAVSGEIPPNGDAPQ